MKKEAAKTLRAFAIELVIYAVLVVAYFFLVLHFLGEGLQRLEQLRADALKSPIAQAEKRLVHDKGEITTHS